jgi:hypothetical protein
MEFLEVLVLGGDAREAALPRPNIVATPTMMK